MLAGHAMPQGWLAPGTGWHIPVTLTAQSLASGARVQAVAVLDASGLFTRTGFAPGAYRISLRGRQSLANSMTVTLTNGINRVDFGTLRGGDSDGDGYVTLVDFSILATTFGLCEGEPWYEDRADYNGDTCITLLDFSLLRANFGAGEGNDPIAAEHAPGNEGGAFLAFAVPSGDLYSGDHFAADVVIDMNGNVGDGASVYFTFDPAVLQVVAVTDGETFPLPIQNDFDNRRGWVAYAAGTLDSPPGGRVVLARVEFVAVGAGGSLLKPTIFMPPRSDVTYGGASVLASAHSIWPVSYTHLRAHETVLDLVCRLLLEKKKNKIR